ASRKATRAMTARPMKNTSFPRVPVCQPITPIVGPTVPDPAYQSVNAERLSTKPEIQVARSPAAVMPTPVKRSRRLTGLVLTPVLGGAVCSAASVRVLADGSLAAFRACVGRLGAFAGNVRAQRHRRDH